MTKKEVRAPGVSPLLLSLSHIGRTGGIGTTSK